MFALLLSQLIETFCVNVQLRWEDASYAASIDCVCSCIWSAACHKLKATSGRYTIYVGCSSKDAKGGGGGARDVA